jgi:molybdopterin-guanine dinucleotide biosynthesis protein A
MVEKMQSLLPQISQRKKGETCIILAGGRSRRMGEDKSLLPVEGKPMIRHVLDQVRPHFDEIIVSSNTPGVHSFSGVKTVPDQEKGKGPLMGLYAALQASSHDTNFVMACDMPNVDIALMREMLRQANHYDAIIPRSPQGFLEPLFAVYNRSMLPIIEEQLAQGIYGVRDVVTLGRVRYVDLTQAQQKTLVNLNTKQAYYRFRDSRATASPGLE